MVAVAWVGVITVLFMLPQVSPVTRETFNYAPIAVLVVLGFAATWWLASASPLVPQPRPRTHLPACRPRERSRSRWIRNHRVPRHRRDAAGTPIPDRRPGRVGHARRGNITQHAPGP